jgi:L-cysteine:1D-myo-inositol 2-amino-2-deoxy-alpha-D-glucopyranoside ligase
LNLSRIEVAPTAPIISEITLAISRDLDTECVIAILVDWCDETESGVIGGAPGELSRVLDELLGLAF